MTVIVPIRYHSEWNDGFGARGWKLEAAIGDDQVIASTAFTGAISNTSVFVHDIVDHHLCGLPLSGHRYEAVAVMLHAIRSGVPVDRSIATMVDEILETGHCGEELDTFLPTSITRYIGSLADSPKDIMQSLRLQMGTPILRNRLIEHYYHLGIWGVEKAQLNWESKGLKISHRGAIGLCLQRLITRADRYVTNNAIVETNGAASVGNEICRLTIEDRVWSDNVIISDDLGSKLDENPSIAGLLRGDH